MSRLTRGLTALLIAMPMVAAPALGTVLASAPAAQAEANPPPGTDLKPVLGWSSWSFFRDTTDAATIEAAARARPGASGVPVRQPGRLLVPVPGAPGPQR